MNDLRFAFRQLLKNPGFTAVAVLTLALGIGANTAIFSLVNAVLLKPLPVRAPQELVAIYASNTTQPDQYRAFSLAEFMDLRGQNTEFAEIAAHQFSLAGITEGDLTRRAMVMQVSASYFALLGVVPARGRAFLITEDTQPAPVAVVSHAYWRKIGADPDLVGKSITLNSTAFTVVGITPPNFTGTMRVVSPDVFVPLGMADTFSTEGHERSESLSNPETRSLLLLGRLKPRGRIEVANAQLRVLATQFSTAFPALRKDLLLSCGPLPPIEFGAGPQKGPNPATLLSALLLAMASVVLVIACLNLANMMLARGAARRKEIALRLALGASRSRILRQLLTEGLLLSLFGGALGLLIARGSMDLFFGSLQQVVTLFTIAKAELDWRVLAATAGFCLSATLFFALRPAWKLSRLDVNHDLKENTGEETVIAPRGSFTSRNLLGLGQVALSLVLLVAGGLFTRSALNAVHGDPGFGLDSGFFVHLDAGMGRRTEARMRQTFRQITERVSALPGVASAALAVGIPFSEMHMAHRLQRAGAARPAENGETTSEHDRVFRAGANIVGADYFRTLGVPLLRGREFTRFEAESTNAPAVALISQYLAEQLWPGEEAVGRRIQFAEREESRRRESMGTLAEKAKPEPPTLEIVGVAPALKEHLFIEEKETAFIYLPLGRHFQSAVHLHVRPAPGANMAALMSAVRDEVRTADAQLPVLAVRSLRMHYDNSFYLWIVRVGALLFGTFGAVATLLALVGVYAAKAYAVARRTREIGIRLALGASASEIQRLILREGATLAILSLGLGLLLAAGMAKVIRGFLYEVTPFDPLVFVTATTLLALAVLMACYFPTRRASKLNPMEALRYE